MPENDIFSTGLGDAGLQPNVDPLVPVVPPVDENPPQDTLSVVNRARVKSRRSLAPQSIVDDRGVPSIFPSDNTNKLSVVKFDVNTREFFNELSDGSLVPKFENYISGTNNEERLARDQSTWEKISRGLTKANTKALTYILDGTIGTVYGIAQGFKQGSFDAVFNNDFGKWVDDTGKRLDSSMANYYTDYEKDMNFLQKMVSPKGAFNFWFNDFAGGMAFVAGTIGSEAIWAFATGGSSLIGSGLKIGAKGAARVVGRTLGKNLGKSTYRALLKPTRRYLNTIQASKLGRAANNARFLYTSAGYESGVESRHMLEESMLQFRDNYLEENGRLPSSQELADFTDSAIERANNVFAANLALVGSSNVAQFGKLFNVGTRLTLGARASRLGNRFIGVAFDTDNIKRTRRLVKSSRLRHWTGNAYKFLEKPFIEGVWEEGMQSVISKSNQNFLMAQYDPESFQANYNMMQGVRDGIAETYGTKEGLNEVFMGMLIGKATSLAQGNISLNPTKASRKRLQNSIEDYNTLITDLSEGKGLNYISLTSTQSKLLDNLKFANQHVAFSNKAENALDNGDALLTSLHFNDAMMAKFMLDDNMGGAGQAAEDIKVVLDTLTPEQIEGFNPDASEADLQEFKDNLKSVVDTQYAIYKDTKEIMQTIDVNKLARENDIKRKERNNYRLSIQRSIQQGISLNKRANDIASTIDALIGNQKYGRALNIYSRLSKNQRRSLVRVGKLEEELETLNEQFIDIQGQISATRELPNQEAEDRNAKLEALIEKRDVIKGRLDAKRKKIAQTRDILSAKIDRRSTDIGDILTEEIDSSEVSEVDLQETLDELQRFENLINTLETEDSQAADNLKILVNSYLEHLTASKQFIEMSKQLQEGNEFQGVSEVFAKFNRDLDNENLGEEFNEFIQGGTFTGDQEFTLRMFRMMQNKITKLGLTEASEQSRILSRIASDNTIFEPIGVVEFSEYQQSGQIPEGQLQSITEKLIYNLELSPRQQIIYEDNKDLFINNKSFVLAREGDSLSKLLAKQVTPLPVEGQDQLSQINEKINEIQQRSNTLNDLDLNNFSEETIPTDEDYNRLEDFYKQIADIDSQLADPNLRPRRRDSLEEDKNTLIENVSDITEKVNEWGRLQGVGDDNVVLSELMRLKVFLESKSGQSQEIVTDVSKPDRQQNAGFRSKVDRDTLKGEEPTLTNIDTLRVEKQERMDTLSSEIDTLRQQLVEARSSGENTQDLESSLSDLISDRDRAEEDFNNRMADSIFSDQDLALESPSKLFANFNTIQTYDTGHIVVKGSKVKGTAQVEISNVSFDKIIDSLDADVVYSREDDSLVVTTNLGTLELMQAERGRIRFPYSETNIDIFNSTGLFFTPLGSGNTRYKVLQRRVADKLVPLESDFTVGQGESMNIENVYNVNPNAKLRLVVDTNDDYNASLLENGEDLQDKLLIYAVDKDENVVGVVKDSSGEGNKLSDKDVELQSIFRDLRTRALNLISEGASGRINLDVRVPISKIYSGHPNFNTELDQGSVIVNKVSIKSSAKKNVVDIGYFKDGIFSYKSSKAYESGQVDYSFTNIFSDESNDGKIIPLIIIKQGVKRIAYPVSVKAAETSESVEEQVDAIIDSNTDLVSKTLKIYEMFAERGLDPNSADHSINPYNITEERLEQVKDILSNNPVLLSNPIDWVDSSRTLRSLLNDVELDININDKPFISPKIRMDFTSLEVSVNKPQEAQATPSTVAKSSKSNLQAQRQASCE